MVSSEDIRRDDVPFFDLRVLVVAPDAGYCYKQGLSRIAGFIGDGHRIFLVFFFSNDIFQPIPFFRIFQRAFFGRDSRDHGAVAFD